MKKVILIISILSLSFFAFGQESEIQEQTADTVLDVTYEADTAEDQSLETADEEEDSEDLSESEDDEATENEFLETENSEDEIASTELPEESQKESTDTEKSEKEISTKSYAEEKALIASYIQANQEKICVEIKADELISQIEAKKSVIDERRKKIAAKEAEYFAQKDDETQKAADAVINAPLEIIETDPFGTQTKDSIARRKANAQKIVDNAEVEKKAHSKELWDSIKEEENVDIAELNKMYSALESSKFSTTSINGELKLEVGVFDGKKGKWKAKVSSSIMGKEDLVFEEIELTYSEVTGKKYIPVDKMSELQFEEFTNNVNKYDSFFSSDTKALFARVSYKIIRWQNASEYRFMPNVIEIVRLDGSSEKVIHKIAFVDPKVFVQIPMIEIRDAKQIAKEKAKTVNRLEREQKAKEKRLGIKLYSDPDVAAKAYNKDPVIQKGRGSVIISVMDSEDFSQPQVGIDQLHMDVTIGLGKFGFIGGDFGVLFPIQKNDFVLNGGLIGGLNVHAGRFLRPYVLVGADYEMGYTVVGKAGAGCDLILAKVFDINLGYTFNYNFGLSEFINQDVMTSIIINGGTPQVRRSYNHMFSVGIGFAW